MVITLASGKANLDEKPIFTECYSFEAFLNKDQRNIGFDFVDICMFEVLKYSQHKIQNHDMVCRVSHTYFVSFCFATH